MLSDELSDVGQLTASTSFNSSLLNRQLISIESDFFDWLLDFEIDSDRAIVAKVALEFEVVERNVIVDRLGPAKLLSMSSTQRDTTLSRVRQNISISNSSHFFR